MAICVEVNNGGFVKVMNPQPVDGASCELLIVSGAEWGHDLFHLSLQGGVDVSAAILLCWASAWVFRAVVDALSIGDTTHGDSDS